MDSYIKQFKEISIADTAVVGGKNSSLWGSFPGERHFNDHFQKVSHC